MATRLYLPASTATTPISPTPDAAWEDTSILGRAVTRPSSISNAMATVSFADNDATDKDVLFRQYVSQPLVAGQTVTGAQAIKAQCRVAERATSCNMFLTVGIRVIASDGSTVRKTVLAVTRDGTEAATSLTNRAFTATSAATNYTTQAGDRLVIEVGMAGDPNAGSDHDSDMRLGDSAASDLAEDDASTSDNRPWVQLNDTLSFVFTASAAVTRGASTASASGTVVNPTFTASAAVTRGASTCSGAATFSPLPAVYTAQAAVTHGASTAAGTATTSGPHPVGKITQGRHALSGRRYGSFAGKPNTPPYSEGTAAVTIGAVTCNGTAVMSGPHPVVKITQGRHALSGRRYGSFAARGNVQYNAAAAVIIGAATCNGSATNLVPTSTGSGVVTIGAPTAAGSATRTVPVYTASAAVSHGASTAAALATFTKPIYAASSAVTIGPVTLSGSAIFLTGAVYLAEASVSVGAPQASGLGTFAFNNAVLVIGAIQCSGAARFAGARSMYGDLLAAVETTLLALALPDIGANVLLKKFTWLRDGVTYPAAFVCPYTEQWPNQGTNASDDTGYGIAITLARISNRDNDLSQFDQLLSWRETVRKAFRSGRISGVSSAHYNTLVEPGPVFDPASFGNQFDATIIYLRAWARESRS